MKNRILLVLLLLLVLLTGVLLGQRSSPPPPPEESLRPQESMVTPVSAGERARAMLEQRESGRISDGLRTVQPPEETP